jgi:UDP-N-acetylmuramoyl-L-alanyl-D-glutamate--2,6-diaminopimelate ligase
MRLDDLLAGVEILDLHNLYPDTEVGSVTADSRSVGPGSVFVAIPGTRVDGHSFVPQVLAAGATLVIQSQPIQQEAVGSFVRVANPRRVFGELSAKLAGFPSRRLSVIGVTGTNGKTSTALLIAHLLNSAGKQAAVLGTLGLRKAGEQHFESTGLTTPDAGVLQRMLAGLAAEGHTHLVMEVSSHALVQERVAGVEFRGGVFTNLTQDHFDFHPTIDDYFEAKALLFTHYLAETQGYSVVNRDDPYGLRLVGRSGGTVIQYGATAEANLVLQNIVTRASGTAWDLVVKNGVWPESLQPGINYAQLQSPLAGRYNAYNCTAAVGVALLEGLSLSQIAAALESFPGVPGRLQRVANSAGINVYVDYAHTPDALLNVLSALRELRGDGAQIITVVGCGGDRDPDKRPKMGAAAQIGSDKLIVTSDNPRSEDPEVIIDQVMAGVDERPGAVLRESDRRRAIHLALREARPGDIVLIAGKGHEDYQILADRTIHFSDVEEVEAYFTGEPSGSAA